MYVATTTSSTTNQRWSDDESRVPARRLSTMTPSRLVIVNGMTIPHSIDPPCSRVLKNGSPAAECSEGDADQKTEWGGEQCAHDVT